MDSIHVVPGTLTDAPFKPALKPEPADKDPEGEQQIPATLPAAPLCEQCGAAPSKYRCPGCQRRSCSLDCVRAHKAASGCSGQRDRTAFVTIQDFDDRTLLSDFRLLEEIGRAEEVARRCRPPRAAPQLPPYLATLVYQASRRGVRLLIMPPGMAKRKANTTWYDARRRTMMWRVEWRFPAAGIESVNERVDEHSILGEVLSAHLRHPAPHYIALRAYAKAGLDKLRVFMRKEKTPADQAAFFPIDTSKPLDIQLANRTVIEFPVFIVALTHEVESYPPPRQAPPPAAASADKAVVPHNGGGRAAPAGQAPQLSPSAWRPQGQPNGSGPMGRPGPGPAAASEPRPRDPQSPASQPLSQPLQPPLSAAAATPVEAGSVAADSAGPPTLGDSSVAGSGGLAGAAADEGPASKRQRLNQQQSGTVGASYLQSAPGFELGFVPVEARGSACRGDPAAASASAPPSTTATTAARLVPLPRTLPLGGGGSAPAALGAGAGLAFGAAKDAARSGVAGAAGLAGPQHVVGGDQELTRDENEIDLEDDDGDVQAQAQAQPQQYASVGRGGSSADEGGGAPQREAGRTGADGGQGAACPGSDSAGAAGAATAKGGGGGGGGGDGDGAAAAAAWDDNEIALEDEGEEG